MPTIAAGSSQTVAIPASQVLVGSGLGVAVLGPGPQAGQQIGLSGFDWVVGPFDGRQQVVYITAQEAVTYDVQTSVFSAPVPGDGITTVEDFAALLALTSPSQTQLARVLSGVGRGVWLYEGTNWRPLGGRMQLAQRNGTIASPVATLTGVTAGSFTLPVIPRVLASMLFPHSRVVVNAHLRRTTATATAITLIRLGTTGGAADSAITSASMAATANQDWHPFASAVFGSSATEFSSAAATTFNGLSTGQGVDRSPNVNTADAMEVSIGITSANTADSFSLISYAVWLEG
jgi:hypothetical protein